MRAKVIICKNGEEVSPRLEYCVTFNGVPMPGQNFMAHQNEIAGIIKSVGWMTVENLEDNAEMDCLVIVEQQ